MRLKGLHIFFYESIRHIGKEKKYYKFQNNELDGLVEISSKELLRDLMLNDVEFVYNSKKQLMNISLAAYIPNKNNYQQIIFISYSNKKVLHHRSGRISGVLKSPNKL